MSGSRIRQPRGNVVGLQKCKGTDILALYSFRSSLAFRLGFQFKPSYVLLCTN